MHFNRAPDCVLNAWHHLPGILFLTLIIYNCRVAQKQNWAVIATGWPAAESAQGKRKNRRGTIRMNNSDWKNHRMSFEIFGIEWLHTAWLYMSAHSFSHDILHQSSANLHQIWGCGIYTMVLNAIFWQKLNYLHLKTKLYYSVKQKNQNRVEKFC